MAIKTLDLHGVKHEDVERLWVYNFSKRKGFTREFSKKEYFEWLYAKHEGARAAFAKKNC